MQCKLLLSAGLHAASSMAWHSARLSFPVVIMQANQNHRADYHWDPWQDENMGEQEGPGYSAYQAPSV